MRRYLRPEILEISDMAEGVYLASGSTDASCWNVEANINKTPSGGSGEYTIHLSGQHNSDHSSTGYTFEIEFNQNVEFVSCDDSPSASLLPTTRLKLAFNVSKVHNHNSNTGNLKLVVNSESGLSILSQKAVECIRK